MKRAAAFVCLAIAFALVGCGQSEPRSAVPTSVPQSATDSTPTYATVDEAAGDLERRAVQGDIDYFKRYVHSRDASSAYTLMQAVARGDVSSDYRSRMESSPTSAHLDFHDHGNFQVYLRRDNGAWMITEMWPCW